MQGNNLEKRWRNLTQSNFVIAECGFGSGLNFLSTCKLWSETAPKNSTLHYIACENHPLLAEDLQRLQQQWPQFSTFATALQEQYPDHTEGLHRIHLTLNTCVITLDLLYGDAATSLSTFEQPLGRKVDAWFLDGFSPRLNPQMWCQELFQSIAKLSAHGATISTYSVAGNIRRGLIQAGFNMEKAPGYGKKRHMLKGRFLTPTTASSLPCEPWFLLPKTPLPLDSTPSRSKTAVVIGGGLAGCATAYSLAKKGWQVELIERQPQLALMASGNPQGIVHCKLSQSISPATSFIKQAFLYATRHYHELAKNHDFQWQQCGLLQLAHNAQTILKQGKIRDKNLYNERFLYPTSPEESSHISKLALKMSGLFLPAAGWLNPVLLCQAYCSHPAITIKMQTNAIFLQRKNQQWQINFNNKPSSKNQTATSQSSYSSADAVVIANSMDAEKLHYCQHYPLITNRGQVDIYQASLASSQLNTILCTNGYILPAVNGKQSIGGSFFANAKNIEENSNDSRTNLQLLRSFLPDISTEFDRQTETKSRVALRCSTPDYLPIIGAVENNGANKKSYAELSRNANAAIAHLPTYEENLFVNIAHGSHGLTSTPLAAEYITAMLNGEPSPLPHELIAAIHPMRFLIRRLKKQQTN